MSYLSNVVPSTGWDVDLNQPFVQIDYDVTKTAGSGDDRARSVGWMVSPAGDVSTHVFWTQVWDIDSQTVDTTVHRSYYSTGYLVPSEWTPVPGSHALEPSATYVIDVWLLSNVGGVLDHLQFGVTMLPDGTYNSYELYHWRVNEATYTEVLNAPAGHGSISDSTDSTYLEISDSGTTTAIGASRGPTVVEYEMEPLPFAHPWYIDAFVRVKYDPALTPISSFALGGEGVVFLGHDSDWTPPASLASYYQSWMPQEAFPGLTSVPKTCMQLFDGDRLVLASTDFASLGTTQLNPHRELSTTATWKATFVHATSDGSFVGPGVFVVSDFYVVLAKYGGSGGPGPDTPTYTGEPPGTEPTGPVEPTPPDPVPMDADLIPGLAQMRAGLVLKPKPTLHTGLELTPMESVRWELPTATKSDPGVGTYTVDGVFIAAGLPYADTWGGVEANPAEYSISVTEEAAASYPNADDVSIGSSHRWLPLVDSYGADTWFAAVGVGKELLGSGYGGVTLDTDLAYVRGKDLHAGGGLILAAEDYLYTDDIDFSQPNVTVAMVVVPRRPPAAFCGLLTTGPDTGVYDKTEPYLDMRYTADGRVVTHYNVHLAEQVTATGVVRAGQPIVVGFSYQRDIKTLVTFVLDRKATYTPHKLDQNHPSTARLFIGNSLAAAEDETFADMDILEVDYWGARMFTKNAAVAKPPKGWSQFNYQPLSKALTRFNRIYGVTVS